MYIYNKYNSEELEFTIVVTIFYGYFIKNTKKYASQKNKSLHYVAFIIKFHFFF